MSALASERLLDLSLIKFLIVGIANTFTGLSIIYLTKWFFGFGDLLANLVGYSIGIALSFALNKRWTFRHTGSTWPSLARFLVVIAVAYLANLVVVLTTIEKLQLNSYLAQALGIIPYVAITYTGSRIFAFTHSRNLARTASDD